MAGQRHRQRLFHVGIRSATDTVVEQRLQGAIADVQDITRPAFVAHRSSTLRT